METLDKSQEHSFISSSTFSYSVTKSWGGA